MFTGAVMYVITKSFCQLENTVAEKGSYEQKNMEEVAQDSDDDDDDGRSARHLQLQ